MKKIINGKLYNTDTADMLGEYWNGLPCGDFNKVDEALYRTKKGAYFIAGSGGALTHYARRCGDNSQCGGEGLRAVTEQEAREWMEVHCTADEYIEAFGDTQEA